MPENNVEEVFKKLEAINRHIQNVQDSAQILGERLIEKGDIQFGITLIANSKLHDNSKFRGLEFEYLHPGEKPDLLKVAIKQHQETNSHHPEYWGGIQMMPRICIAEMVCDLKARSEEFGSSLWDYLKGEFSQKHNLTPGCKIFKTIKEFVDLLLEPQFKKVN